MGKITYDDKIQLNENANIPNNQKCRAVDMNEIKSVVNGNDTNVGSLSNLNTTDKTSVVNAINEVNTNQINSSTYSTDEIVIGTYLGKPLYRKVITGYLNDAPFNHGIKNAVFHKVNGIYLTTAGLTFPIPSTRPNYQEYQIGMWVSKTQVIFEKGNAVGNYYTEILLEYTKTTD